MRIKRNFTLLEVMVAISLLIMASGAIGWKMHGMIERKRFTAGVERLHSRLLTCRRLALNMQADWRGSLQWNGEKWLFEAYCIDSPRTPKLIPFSLDALSISLDGEKKESMIFDFAASGEILPRGLIVIGQKKMEVKWKLPDLFLLEEGSKRGPIHPDELK